jgi:DNA segregation ATPase FtsK/SpoIIIE, S-DNA-T family
MVPNSLAAQAREYMRTHGVRYQQALAAVSKHTGPPASHGLDQRFLKALGIRDISTYDPIPMWALTRTVPSLRAPIGYRRIRAAIDPSAGAEGGGEEVFFTDLLGGTGPAVVNYLTVTSHVERVQLLSNIVAATAALHSPSKVQFVLIDSGNGTFAEVRRLPHVQALLEGYHLQDAAVVGRLLDILDILDILEQEITARLALLERHRLTTFEEYCQMLDTHPALPAIPCLVILADLSNESDDRGSEARRTMLNLTTRVAARGAAAGVHLITAGPHIDETLLQEMWKHLTFGISLKSDSEVQRRPEGATEADLFTVSPGVKTQLVKRLRRYAKPANTTLARALANIGTAGYHAQPNTS